MEIERKFKVKRLPEGLERYEKKKIEQGYLCSGPIVRIRRSNDNYILTYKSKKQNGEDDAAIINEEVELPLTEQAYLHLKDKADNNMIEKTRYIIPLEKGLKAELDIFEGKLSGLYFVEVEFPDEETSKSFNPPDWFAEDVSFDKRYRNNYLSKVNSYDELGI